MEQCEICTGVENSDRSLCGECAEMVREIADAFDIQSYWAASQHWKDSKGITKRYFVQTPLGEMEVEKPNTWERR